MAEFRNKRPVVAAFVSALDTDRAQLSGHPPTIEDRLEAKAKRADRTDFSQQVSLGQLTREERRKILFGE